MLCIAHTHTHTTDCSSSLHQLAMANFRCSPLSSVYLLQIIYCCVLSFSAHTSVCYFELLCGGFVFELTLEFSRSRRRLFAVGRSVSQQLFSAWHLLLPLSLHTMLHFDLIGHLSFSSSIDLVVVGGRRGTISSGTSPLSVCLCLCSTSPVLSLCQWQLINRPITGWLFSELRRR